MSLSSNIQISPAGYLVKFGTDRLYDVEVERNKVSFQSERANASIKPPRDINKQHKI